MNIVVVLFLLLFGVIFLMFVKSQSASVPKRRKSRNAFSYDAGSDLSILSISPPQDIPPTASDSLPEASYIGASVDNYASNNVDSVVNVDTVNYGGSGDFSGSLGSALADTIDSGAGSSGAFDSGNFGGSGDFGGGGNIDGSSS